MNQQNTPGALAMVMKPISVTGYDSHAKNQEAIDVAFFNDMGIVALTV